MASASINLASMFLSLNLLFFSCVASTASCGPAAPPKPKHKPTHSAPTPAPATKPAPKTKPTPTAPASPVTKSTPKPTPSAPTSPSSSPTTSSGKCPVDTLKLAVCANVLGGLAELVVGPGSKQCCSLLQGLADGDAAVCLCTVIKANLLGANLNVSLTLSLMFNACGRVPSADYTCA